jgi:hypothetical protein
VLCEAARRGWSNKQIKSVIALYPNGPFERNFNKKGLDEKGLDKEIDAAREEAARGKAHGRKPEAAPELSDADRAAIEALRAGRFDAFLEAAKKDPSLPFIGEAVTLLAQLGEKDPRAWQTLRADLKAAKVQITALNEQIEECEKETGKTGGAGKPIVFEETIPWGEPVEGAELLTGIAAALRKYMIMNATHSDATALWVVLTYTHDFRDAAPLLVITSPVPGCAKTRLLDTVSRAVLRPLAASGMTSASLVNVIDKYRPTFLIDEYDALMKGEQEKAEAVRGIVNAAHKRSGAFLIKNVPTADGWDPRSFSVWALIAIAGIDKPQRTLIERGLIITLQKKLRKEAIARLRMKDGDDLRRLARKIARWVADNEAQLRDIDPAMPEELSDRECDKWDPLIAIADVAGGEWPARARKIAVEMSKVDAQDVLTQDDKQLLLTDIRDIFARLYPSQPSNMFPDGHPAYKIGRGPRIATERLLRELHELEERDWVRFGKDKRPLTNMGLFRLLSGYEIRPNRVRVNDNGIFAIPTALDLIGEVSEEALKNLNTVVRQGYYMTSFAEAFDRYL